MDQTMHETGAPQSKEAALSAEHEQREKGLRNWVENRVLPKVPKEAIIDFSAQLKTLPVVERANRLYERLMVFSVDQRLRKAEAQADQIDPDVVDVVSEIASLWQDTEVQQAFVSKFADARIDAKLQRASSAASDFRQTTEMIEETRTAFTAESRRLFLQEAKTDLQISAASGRVERYAQELVQLEKDKQKVFTLEGNEPVAENTDVSAQIMYETLRSYQTQAKEGFVWVPSRTEIGRKIKTVLDSGKYPLLIGPPGTGKTTQIRAISQELTGTTPVQVDASSSSGVHDMMATTEMGKDESFRRYVGIGRGFTGFTDSQAIEPECPHGRVVEFNEISQLNLDRGLALIKGVAAKRTGSILHEEVRRPILPGSTIVATSNEPISDERLDREFGRIPINYFEMTQENPELYEFMLSTLLTDQGNLPASRQELAPYFEKVKVENGRVLEGGQKIVGEERLVENQTDARHGTLYRLSFAVRALQDAYIHGSQYNEKHMAKSALYYDLEDGKVKIKNYVPDLTKPGADQGVSGEMLTLHAGSSTLTVETINNWIKGFRTRMESDIPQYHTETMSDWIKVKLEEHIAQASSDEADKIRAIFDHFHLFDEAPAITDTQPLTPKEIGYLSPRVKRPVEVEHVTSEQYDKSTGSRSEGQRHTDRQVLLEDGSPILVRLEPYTLFTNQGKKIHLKDGRTFTMNGEKLRFVGSNSEGSRAVVEIVETDGLHRLIELDQLRSEGEFDNRLEDAREIMGEDFLGVEAVKKTFGVEVRDDQVPELEFTQEELERAKQLGQRLILRVHFTMKGMQENFASKRKGKVLWDTGWYQNERFFTTQVPTPRWSLVGKDVMPGSTGKNYLDQTRMIADHLKDEVFKGQSMPDEYRAAINEYGAKKPALEKAMKEVLAGSGDWKKLAENLSALKLNQLFRHNPAEVLYDMLMVYENLTEKDSEGNVVGDETRFLPDKYTWTNARSRGGRLVGVGGSGADGAGVSLWDPSNADDYLGVAFSR